MIPRVYAPLSPEDQRCIVEGPEAHHLIHALRARHGDRIDLFNGAGWEFEGRIESLDRRRVAVTIEAARAVERQSARELAIWVAMPKGERQRWLIEKCVELGVAELRPLVTERSVVVPSERSERRWRRYVIEASKQSGRTHLMKIGRPCDWQAELPAEQPAGLCCVAHPLTVAGARRSWSTLAADPSYRQATVAVGPEGGFTEEEVGLAVELGWSPITLGPLTLRIETAAIAIAANWLL